MSSVEQRRAPLPPCPYCKADENSLERRTLRTNAQRVGVESQGSLFSPNAPVTALVCTQCGYVRLFVNPQDL